MPTRNCSAKRICSLFFRGTKAHHRWGIHYRCPAWLIVLLLSQAAYSLAHPFSASSIGLHNTLSPPTPPHSPRLTGTVTVFWNMLNPPHHVLGIRKQWMNSNQSHLKNVMIPYPICGNLGLQHIAIHTSHKCSINYSWELCANLNAL